MVSYVTVQSGVSRVNYDFKELVTPTLGREVVGFTPAARQPYTHRRGKRLSPPAFGEAPALGFTDVVEVADGLHAVITHWPEGASQSAATWAETVPEQYGYLYVGLEGDGRIEIDGLGCARRLGTSCSLTVAPPASIHIWRSGPGVGRRGMCIAFHARYLRQRYPDLLAHCGGTLGPWLANCETRLREFEVPLLPVMTAATATVLSTRLEGEARHVLVNSATELLICLAIAALADLSCRAPRLSSREQTIVHRVRAIIDEKLGDPPKLEDLARAFGINRTKLRFAFKEIFGISTASYLLEQRMRVAFDLLERQAHSVSAVAAHVGYPHLCNFTTAFKRRFGQTPSRIARQRLD